MGCLKMNKKLKSVLLLVLIFLVGIVIANVSFAATVTIKDESNLTGSSYEYNYKGSASNLKVKSFSTYIDNIILVRK